MFKQIERNNKIFESEEFKKDKYKFNIVYKILSGEEVLLYSDEENYFLARNKVGMPTWIWTKEGLGKEKYEEIKQAMDLYLTDIEYDQFTCKKEFYDYLKESKYEKFNNTVYFEMGFLTCEKVKDVKKVEGQMQLATEEDLEDMSKALYKFIVFMNDTLKIDEEVVISQAKEMAEELIKEKRFYCWKNDSGKIVSIAKYEEKEGTARIGHVYTVEEERGKGYAANLIHDLTEILLEKGLKVLLYTDYNYKASNKAYINAGYEDKGILITFTCSKNKRKIIVDEQLKEKCNVNLGCIFYKTNVLKTNKELWDYIENAVIGDVKKKYDLNNLTEQINIKTSRQAYKNIGKEPSRYRVSSEALIRRILQEKGLYKINNVVDTNNLISIETGYSVGSYDLKNVKGDLVFRIGKEKEQYQGIGKDIINIENLPVFADNIGPYGSPTSDSTRAMITNESKEILTVLISFNGKEGLEESVELAKNYLTKYANAEEIESIIV